MDVPEKMTDRPTYNAALDGLRCVSVAAVILYHLGLPVFGGGFVGVDIFFVLSGFLITSVLAAEWENGAFSLVGFWFRRIRRLLPAYIAMATVTLAVGYAVLLPKDFASFGNSLLYQAGFSANLLFRNEVGYFDAPAQLKPLLHTWSLAVEEQFYFVFPLVLWLGMRWGRSRFAAGVGLLGVASFLYGLVYPGSEANAFFLPQTRVWEILLGCALALVELPTAWRTFAAPVRQIGSVLALALVLVPIFVYTDSTRFPGWATLAPVAGAGLLIALGSGTTTYVHRFLGQWPLPALGRLSYSLYLWHWPVMVFSRYVGVPVTLATQAAIVLVTLLISWVFYACVEEPFRRGISARYPRAFVAGALGSSLLLALGGFWISKREGLRGRFSAAALAYADGSEDRMHWWEPEFSRPAFSAPTEGETGLREIGNTQATRRILFWGNSHMGHLLPAAQRLADKYGAKVYFPSRNCAWISVRRPSHRCGEVAAHVTQLLDQGFFSQVVWANFWQRLAREPAFEVQVEESARIFAASRTPTTLVAPVPVYAFEVPAYLALRETYTPHPPAIGQSLAQHWHDTERVRGVLERLGTKKIKQIDLATALCPSSACQISREGKSLYSDSNHLSVSGTRVIEPTLEELFRP